MKRLAAALALAATAGAALADPAADPSSVDVSGLWEIEIVSGPSLGDGGEIRIDADGAAEMVFRDSRTDEVARQRCRTTRDAAALAVRCAVDLPGWLPDDFDLKIVGPDRMEGPHISAVSGYAVFRRKRPEPVS